MNPNDIHCEPWPTPPEHGMLTGKIPVGVKAVHIPTGMVEICDTERSQHANRDKAIEALALRLARGNPG